MTQLPTWIKEIEERAEKASPPPWSLDHGDTYVSAEKVPKQHDWDWICGAMSVEDTDYQAGTADEDLRGHNIKNNCRFIAHSRTDIPKLISALKIAVEALEDYKHRIPLHRVITPESAAYEQSIGLGRVAREALEKIEDPK